MMTVTEQPVRRCAWLVAFLVAAAPTAARAQSSSARPTGRVSVYVNSAGRTWDDGNRQRDTDISTGATFESPRTDDNGVEFRLDLRHTRYSTPGRADRLSLYDGYAGGRFGGDLQVRVRAGHMWLQDLGTMGAVAGGLIEVGQHRDINIDTRRFRAGFFSGLEPKIYDTGYASDVRKYGGYAAYESGYLRRHVVGYTTVKQGAATERSVLSFTNFIPAGRAVFAYQAAEYEVKGPANGTAQPGLSYFLTNVRVSAGRRVELNGTYNRGRSLDARQLTDDVINQRALTAQAIEGLHYESGGGRVTVEIVPRLRVYAGYSRDRTNRDDSATGRSLFGGHAGNVLGTGFDLSASDSRIQRATGPYHSRYLSVGRSLGRAVYVSVDYSTSLSVIRFLRSDGVIIETRPSTRRYSGSASITLNRYLSLLTTVDQTVDDSLRELRVLSGLSYRIR
jgi:hypothetical protein